MDKLRDEIGILIADNHPGFRQGLRVVLDTQPGFRVLGEAEDGEQTLALASQLKPRVLLLDIRTPRLSGIEVLRHLKTLAIPTRTLLLTATLEGEQIVEALQLGARGIVLKDAAADVLVEGIRRVVAGHYWFCRESVPDLVRAISELKRGLRDGGHRPEFHLARRETQIIALIQAGYTNKDIARKLAVSEHLVKHHLINIFDKLGVANRFELVLFSLDHHLTHDLQPSPNEFSRNVA
jgi:two-component system, NarL family, nitrate/nitrite response regulator NarL